jgi:hypothetical protein
VTGEKGCEVFGHASGILHLQQVRRVGQDEVFDVGQPRQQKLLSLGPDATQLLTLRPNNRKDRLDDATRILPAK